MKKVISIILTLTTLLALSVPANAETATTITSGDFVFTIGDDGASVKSYTGTEQNVVIPSEVQGKTVISIGNAAFSGNNSITSVVIPETVEGIMDYAFIHCTNLSSITANKLENVKSIGPAAFYNTAWYNSKPDGLVYLDDCLIDYKTSTTETLKTLPNTLYVQNGTRHIAQDAFKDTTGLATVVLPEGVEIIDESAFENCQSLTSINLPLTLTTIGSFAFKDCVSLSQFSIPQSVTAVGMNILQYTAWEENQDYGILSLDNWMLGYKYQYDEQDYSINSPVTLEISGGIKNIAVGALFEAELLETLVIGEGVETIGIAAFAECPYLSEVTLPQTLKKIDISAFENCPMLINIAFPSGLQTIGSYAFYRCPSLSVIELPTSVTEIEPKAIGYSYNETSNSVEKLNVTIAGEGGSAAQTYANNNGFAFVDVSAGEEIPTTTVPSYTNPTENTNPTETTNPTENTNPTQPTTPTENTNPTQTTTTTTQNNTENTTNGDTTPQKGDVNGDGKISVADARKLVVAIAKNDTEELLEFGDVNNDGKVSVADARKIVVAIAKNDFNF